MLKSAPVAELTVMKWERHSLKTEEENAASDFHEQQQ